MALVRRFALGDVPKLTRRAWEDVAPRLEDFLRKMYASETGGIPSGFNNITPTTVEIDGIADAGDEVTGWAAANHKHDLRTDEIYGFAFLGY